MTNMPISIYEKTLLDTNPVLIRRNEIIFTEKVGDTKVSINHTDIPEGMGTAFKQGWQDYYFKPMKEYFK